MKAYVDGSFIAGSTGFGAVIVQNGKIIHEISGKLDNDGAHRQVSGEIEAVLQVLRWCDSNAHKKIEIYYDYEGVAAWAEGRWKTNVDLTKSYAKEVRGAGIHITWVKVKSHSGDHFNDVADELAKKGALGTLPQSKKKSAKSATKATPVSESAMVICFSDLLLVNGFDYEISEMKGFRRFEILKSEKRAGIIDLYFKKSGEIKADFRGFSDKDLESALTKLWNTLLANLP